MPNDVECSVIIRKMINLLQIVPKILCACYFGSKHLCYSFSKKVIHSENLLKKNWAHFLYSVFVCIQSHSSDFFVFLSSLSFSSIVGVQRGKERKGHRYLSVGLWIKGQKMSVHFPTSTRLKHAFHWKCKPHKCDANSTESR